MGIVGAGPAGLTLGNLLQQAGVPCVVLERGTREYIETRPRAGVIEHRAVQMLTRHGLADRLLREADRHGVCEFRVNGQAHEVDYSSLYDGQTHYVYPQQEVVRDLVGAFVDGGGDVRFGVSDVELHDIEGPAPALTWTSPDGTAERLDCSFIGGADGFHGVTRRSIPAGAIQEFSHQHGIEWLSILAEAPPSTHKVIYALHPDGFAGHMLRSATVSRYYLQVPVDDTVDNWPDERVWAELHKRFALRDSDWSLTEGRIIEKRILDMRSHVVEPMNHGNLFLLGDAAHIITPVGAKGMNLALHDAEVLAAALTEYHRTGDDSGLRSYSEVCLRRVWRAQEFSQWMVFMLHRSPEPFLSRLGQARLEHLIGSGASAGYFAQNYVGP
ncbi:p-hydroxybenzoate 3-monooxygenase [Saccharothrix tamanrassetensis]|uniref:p-hydroxybenzoate 3-monooxygenase n=1 Tax=Saccharothrix tamanrassetensis TaxID=1051531 RepID=A0A841CSM3_9PSEU|nr:4-hydroxybenzoate 3-monooxygenase [Saccharothrix tamanrassetensis]MBB5959324.1 p-hydroxybenzoate 3-monooxygenase [Saccharothrix tamanrassetensis]